MRRAALATWLLFCTLMLSACGWQLRGDYDLPDELQEINLVSADPLHPIMKRLARAFDVAGVKITADAAITLRLERIERDQRTVALDRRARPSERGIWLALPFVLQASDGSNLLGPAQLTANRIYRYDPNNVVAMNEEEKLIDKELQDNLVAQLMRRLRRMDPALLQGSGGG